MATLGAATLGACGPVLSPVEPLATLELLSLTGQESADLPVHLPSDEPVLITVTGRAIDVQVTIRDDRGETIAATDAPGRATGIEVLLIDPGPARQVSVVVTGHDYATVRGHVTVEAHALPAVTRADRRRIEALRLETVATASDPAGGIDAARMAAQTLAEASTLYEAVGDRVAAARTHLAEAWVRGWRIWDYSGAVRAAEAALDIAERAGASELQAHALLCLGAARTSVAQGAGHSELDRPQMAFAAAMQALDAAVLAYGQLDLPALEALALSYGGVAEHDAGHWDAAEAKYVAASEKWLAIGDAAHHTLALQSLALLWHERGEPRRAIEYFDQTARWRSAIPETDYAYILHNSALPHYVLGQFDDAIERYYAAMRILAESGDRPGEARALHGIGTVLQAAGETERAREVLEQVIAMRPAGSDDRARAYALLLLGEIEHDLGHDDRAIALHEEALSLLRSPSDEIRARVALAGDLAGAHRYDAARAQLDAALLLPLPETHRVRARAWREMGTVQAALSNHAASEAAFDEALRYFDRTGADLERAYVLEARARTAFQADDFARASDDAAAALAILARTSSHGIHAGQRAVFLASRRSTLGLQIDALMARAVTARAGGDEEQARAFERAAFDASDRSRAVMLLDALAADGAGVPQELRVQQRDLLEQLAGKRSRHDALLERPEQDPAAIQKLSAEIVQIRSELDAIAARIGDVDRSSASVRATASGTAPLVPPANALVAEYFLGDRRSWLFLVTDRRLVVKSLPARDEIDGLARQVHVDLSSPPVAGPTSRASIDEISELLIGPILTVEPQPRLLLVPDGSLHLLPLPALADLTDLQLTDRQIMTIPSLLAITTVPRDRAPAPHLLAMVADPVFGPDDPRLGHDAKELLASLAPDAVATQYTGGVSSPAELQRLPAAAIEARDILAQVPASERLALIGFDARRDRVVAANLDAYRILHFATHAWSDSRDPALATLGLSSLDATGRHVDGVLRAGDIADLHLRADLVVLSGCETAVGREIDGEGLLGLASAFLRAGAESVVASLWRVPDTSSAYLMREFYRMLIEEGRPPEQALVAAQRRVRSQPRWAEPYFWAGFQVVSVSPDAARSDDGENVQ